ncbi:hypothetical protein SR1949_06920 [Sphaerospermopsis reniformis]|uniref:Uncharacterized protein n=1 Tax=Sphaerospermopsis reniformis TaxID=531300 RepID=A0A479ZSV7_9CYAN|nr:hypothetical protein SR1949_06920 [Sphaerospermopsis reniformis]
MSRNSPGYSIANLQYICFVVISFTSLKGLLILSTNILFDQQNQVKHSIFQEWTIDNDLSLKVRGLKKRIFFGFFPFKGEVLNLE